jgi:ligand-binding sensor domain-containing protein/DNA-binding CsgD family transcriptional regulator
MKKHFLLILICNAFIGTLMAQPKLAIPSIKSYTTADYNAGSGIWDIKQGKNGMLYLANNDGLLTFDGSYWKTYVLPNKSAIKSLEIDPSGKIYVGGQDEIGYFFPDQSGILKFHSLKHLMPESARQFADIWNIVLYKNEVFFRTIECIFELKNNKIYTYDAPGGWIALSQVGSALLASDKDTGLLVFKDSRWQPYGTKTDQLKTQELRITGITAYNKDSLLLSTRKNGLFLMSATELKRMATSADEIFSSSLINAIAKIAENSFAICTASKGLIIIDGQGKLIEQFSNKHGLQNNNINSILLDNSKNLWLGLENGLDFINYNTSVKHIYPSRENHVQGNAVAIFGNKLYIGSSNSLYSMALNNQQKDMSTGTGLFTEIKNTRGAVLSLTQVNNNLLAGHQDGVMNIINDQAKLVTNGPGAWMLKAFTPGSDVIAGTYTGFQLLKAENGGFVNAGKIDGIYESLGNLARDSQDNLWATHPHRGIFKAKLSADRKRVLNFQVYTKNEGLPSILNNRVYFIKNKIIAATENGIYEYDIQKNKFIPSAFYKPIFGNNPVAYLTEDNLGNLWFVSNQRVGLVDFSRSAQKAQFKLIYFPELTGQTVKGAEHIYPYNMENIFIGSNDGVFHLNYKRYVSSESKLNVMLTSVKAIGEKDSLIFGGYFLKNGRIASTQDSKQITSLSKDWNSFHFEYSSTLFAQKGNEEFSYKLIGFDNDWSKWSTKTEKDYTNLSYGKYTFSVKVRNNLGNASEPVNYTFIVEPAWYQTVWAYLLYLVIFASIIYYFVNRQQKRFALHQKKHEEEQKRLNYLHGLEMDRNEKEIITLKNDNLEAELNYKNRELATVTMHLVDRGKLLQAIKDELIALTQKLNIPDADYQFRRVYKLLNDTENGDEDWDHFAIYFDQVYNNYLATMKVKFPNLSATDLKLCAYLRLNLSSKETAQLLNISLKGVEISRYRLRKKLQLPTEVNLYDFLIESTN